VHVVRQIIRIGEARRRPCPRAPRAHRPSKDKQRQKQLASAPALLDKIREGSAALVALAAKTRKGPSAAD
jgi:hypothetical protein